jgi:hypothetical protein
MEGLRYQRLFMRGIAIIIAVAACFAVIAAIQVHRRVTSAETTARDQLRNTASAIANAADTVETVGTGLANGATTATNVQGILTNASGIVRTAGTTTEGVGNTFGFRIPLTRIRPFGAAEDALVDQAAQINALSDSLDHTATSLGANATDLRALGAHAESTATMLRAASRSVGQFVGDGATTGGLARFADSVRALCVIAALLGLLFIGVAVILWMLAARLPDLDAIADAVAARLATPAGNAVPVSRAVQASDGAGDGARDAAVGRSAGDER